MGGMMGKDVDVSSLTNMGRQMLNFGQDVYNYGRGQYETFAVPQLQEMKNIVGGDYSSPLASKIMAAPTQTAAQASGQAKQQALEGGLGPVQTQRLLSTIDTEKMNTLSTQAMSMVSNMLQSLIGSGQTAWQIGTQGGLGFSGLGSNMMQTGYSLQLNQQMANNKLLSGAIGQIASLGTYITGPEGLGLWGAAE
jgi:hypothetical protein